jgi:hypothetical protein
LLGDPLAQLVVGEEAGGENQGDEDEEEPVHGGFRIA